jgi:hypothetical protein
MKSFRSLIIQKERGKTRLSNLGTWQNRGSIVVKQSPHHPKVEGLSPPRATSTRREIMTNNRKLGMWKVAQW